MSSTAILYLLLILVLSLTIILVILEVYRRRKKQLEIIEYLSREFGAKDYGKAMRFEYRGYDVYITFSSGVKVSISHNKEVKGIRAPKGMKLTPMFLTLKIKKKEELREKLDEGIEFLNSIPTR
jgi:hypothetical protein